MKASVARRIDYPVKYKREFGQLSGRLQQRRRWRPRWRRHNDEMNPRRSEDERKDTESKPKFNLKSRILSLIELLQSNPSLKRGKRRPLPAEGNPLANLTTIKAEIWCPGTSSRRCVQSMLCTVDPGLYKLTSLNPTHDEWLTLMTRNWRWHLECWWFGMCWRNLQLI